MPVDKNLCQYVLIDLSFKAMPYSTQSVFDFKIVRFKTIDTIVLRTKKWF